MKTAKRKKKNDFQKSLPLLLIALPGIVYLIINNYVPMMGLFLAFKDYNFMKGIFKSDWCGLQNFRFLFATKDALTMTRNTVLYNVAFIVIGTVIAIFIAILMCELGERVRVKFYQASMLLPNMLSWVVIGFVAYAFLNADTGFINNTVLAGMGKEPVSWYTYQAAWPLILILVFIWKNAGYQSIVYMSSVSGIDKSLYEAAALDGASRLQRVIYVDLPCIAPTIIISLIMNTGSILSVGFEKVFLMQNPVNYGVSEIISTYVYKTGIVQAQFSFSTAVGLFNAVVNFVILLLVNTVAGKVSETSLF